MTKPKHSSVVTRNYQALHLEEIISSYEESPIDLYRKVRLDSTVLAQVFSAKKAVGRDALYWNALHVKALYVYIHKNNLSDNFGLKRYSDRLLKIASELDKSNKEIFDYNTRTQRQINNILELAFNVNHGIHRYIEQS